MNKRLYILIVFIVVALCTFGIFHLVFPEHSEMMVWCTVSGIFACGTILGGMSLVSSKSALDVKNSASLWVLNTAALILFGWTLVFAFFIGNYSEQSYDFDTLYIGYLIIIAITVPIFFAANRGSAFAQQHSDKIQQLTDNKTAIVSNLISMLPELESLYTDVRADEVKAYNNCIDRVRRLPVSTLADNQKADIIQNSVNCVKAAISSADINAINTSINSLEKTLKSAI